MRILLLTKEYPPNIYGGAGVHIDFLSRELSKLCNVEVRCFGDQSLETESLVVRGFEFDSSSWSAPEYTHLVFDSIRRSLDFNVVGVDADIVHAHTWYTYFGGMLAKLNFKVPLVVTAHSLELLKPWKSEHSSNGYATGLWLEKITLEMADAIIAVSEEAKQDVLDNYNVSSSKVSVIHNGIDSNIFKPVRNKELVQSLGIDTNKPYILFVGRATPQKGILHLLRAMDRVDQDIQLVLIACDADGRLEGSETGKFIQSLSQRRPGVVWLREDLDISTKVALYSHAEIFVCPSIYEPFGIVNLEAMACETAVIATATGGIKDVVVDGVTGVLIPLEYTDRERTLTTDLEHKFEEDLADAINKLMKEDGLRLEMGKAGRRRAIEHFGWKNIAKKTFELYKSILDR